MWNRLLPISKPLTLVNFSDIYKQRSHYVILKFILIFNISRKPFSISVYNVCMTKIRLTSRSSRLEVSCKKGVLRNFHSHKKREDNMSGILDRVFFAAELEFAKILVPRLPQLIMPAVNYVIYGCSSSRTTPGFITIQELHTGGKTLLQLFLKIG